MKGLQNAAKKWLSADSMASSEAQALSLSRCTRHWVDVPREASTQATYVRQAKPGGIVITAVRGCAEINRV